MFLCSSWRRHLEFLKWARANGCEWNEETCRVAAYYGGHHKVRISAKYSSTTAVNLSLPLAVTH